MPNALVKKDELIKWLESKRPEFGTFSDKESFAYITYPGILVVEHWTFEKKTKFVGLLTGAVAGLATITPAAGFVTPQAAMLIVIVAGTICYAAVYLKNKRN